MVAPPLMLFCFSEWACHPAALPVVPVLAPPLRVQAPPVAGPAPDHWRAARRRCAEFRVCFARRTSQANRPHGRSRHHHPLAERLMISVPKALRYRAFAAVRSHPARFHRAFRPAARQTGFAAALGQWFGRRAAPLASAWPAGPQPAPRSALFGQPPKARPPACPPLCARQPPSRAQPWQPPL